MSRPATSWSRRYTESASTYCSRKRDVTIASRKDRVPRFSVYQLGLGSDPVMVVGRSFPAVAFSMRVSPSGEIDHQTVQRRRPGAHVLFRTDLELDLGLREQSALEQLRVGGAIELLERHDDTQPPASPLIPVRAAEDVAALGVGPIGAIRVEKIETADSRPHGET